MTLLRNLITIFYSLSAITLFSQKIVNGPMLGYTTPRESAVWVQTDKSCSVSLVYWDVRFPKQISQTESIITKKENGYIAHLITNLLEPGLTYGYKIKINGILIKAANEQKFVSHKLWRWRGDAPDYDFVAGSCMYVNEPAYDRPGKGYGSNYSIFSSIHKDKPDFMLWLGDNTYLRESDWDSKQGIYHRYAHSRAIAELKPLLASTHHYAIWDDHDYGPNDSDWTYPGRQWTKDAFKDYWLNPVYGVGGSEGITSYFNWYDSDFFLLDNRWYRSKQDPEGQILGETQLNWLLDALSYSPTQFKFVALGGQVLNSVAKYENYSIFKKEREKLLTEIDKRKIKNVIFLNGDRHHSEVSKWTGPNGTVIYDITSSSLTSGTGSNRDEVNEYRVPNSLIVQNNYALLNVVGNKDERKIILKNKDINGVQLFEYIIEPQK
jgi:alkaline phosphatase D